MSIYDRDYTGICPRAIATEASPVAIENMIRAMQDEILMLDREKTRLRNALMPFVSDRPVTPFDYVLIADEARKALGVAK